MGRGRHVLRTAYRVLTISSSVRCCVAGGREPQALDFMRVDGRPSRGCCFWGICFWLVYNTEPHNQWEVPCGPSDWFQWSTSVALCAGRSVYWGTCRSTAVEALPSPLFFLRLYGFLWGGGLAHGGTWFRTPCPNCRAEPVKVLAAAPPPHKRVGSGLRSQIGPLARRGIPFPIAFLSKYYYRHCTVTVVYHFRSHAIRAYTAATNEDIFSTQYAVSTQCIWYTS